MFPDMPLLALSEWSLCQCLPKVNVGLVRFDVLYKLAEFFHHLSVLEDISQLTALLSRHQHICFMVLHLLCSLTGLLLKH